MIPQPTEQQKAAAAAEREKAPAQVIEEAVAGLPRARAERIRDVAEQIPTSKLRIYLRAATGKANPRGAIKAACQQCMGWDTPIDVAVRECTGYSCPLWPVRPGA